MKPYYEQSGVTIYHGDCRDVLPLLTVDVVVMDPPYGIDLVTKTSRDHTEFPKASVLYQDDAAHVRALIVSAMPLVLSHSNRALVFPGQRMLFAYPEPDSVGCVFVPNGCGRTSWGFQCMQPILFYGKDPWMVDGNGGRPNSFSMAGQPNRERFDHPCPKPQSWMNWAIQRASRPGEVVCDPFMGTGTTLVSAKRFGRIAIGIEIEERYCEIAANRLAQETLPLEIGIEPR